MTLLQRIVLVLLAGWLALLLVTVVSVNTSLHEQLRDEYLATEHEHLRTLTARIESKFQQRAELIARQAQLLVSASSGELFSRKDRQELLEMAIQNELFVEYVLLDAQGVAIGQMPVLDEREGVDYSDRPFVQEVLLSQRPTLSPPVTGRVTGLPSLFYLHPIFNAQHDLIAILTARVALEQDVLFEQIRSEFNAFDGELMIIDRQHQLYITATDREKVLQPITRSDYQWLTQESGGSSRGVDEHGQVWLYAWKTLPMLDWVVIKKAPEKRVLASASRYLHAYISVTIPLLLLLGLLTLLWVYSVLRPVRYAIKRLDQALKHDTASTTLPVARQDELGQLLNAFNALQALRDRQQAMKDELLSIVSHELRTPLTSIRGALGMLGSDVSLPDSQRTQLMRVAERNTNRLLMLVNDLLDLASLSSGKLQLQLSPHALEPVLKESMRDFSSLAAERGISLELRLPDSPVYAQVDALRLQQVISNLLSNAVKFSDDGAGVTLSLAVQGDLACISVTDEGPGIPLDFQPHVFERFAQADASDRRRESGTGLGLAIARELVREMDGDIRFTSQPGEGTCFQVLLPIDHTGDALS